MMVPTRVLGFYDALQNTKEKEMHRREYNAKIFWQ
jgi:hypothetical protein